MKNTNEYCRAYYHAKTKHTLKEKQTCPFCQASVNKSSLTRHKKTSHCIKFQTMEQNGIDLKEALKPIMI